MDPIKKQRRPAITLKNNKAKLFFNEMRKYNTTPFENANQSSLGSDPASPYFTNNSAVSVSGSEPINTPIKRGVRFTNNTMKQNKNTRGLVYEVSPNRFPYLYRRSLNPNNQYARNLSIARQSIDVEPRKFHVEKVKLSPKMATLYGELVAMTMESKVPTLQNIQNILNVSVYNRKITRKQANLLWKKAKFNFAK